MRTTRKADRAAPWTMLGNDGDEEEAMATIRTKSRSQTGTAAEPCGAVRRRRQGRDVDSAASRRWCLAAALVVFCCHQSTTREPDGDSDEASRRCLSSSLPPGEPRRRESESDNSGGGALQRRSRSSLQSRSRQRQDGQMAAAATRGAVRRHRRDQGGLAAVVPHGAVRCCRLYQGQAPFVLIDIKVTPTTRDKRVDQWQQRCLAAPFAVFVLIGVSRRTRESDSGGACNGAPLAS